MPRQELIFDDQAGLPATVPPHLTLLKHRYDLFSHPRADELIALYAASRPLFVVYGVATDYCVSAAVEGFLRQPGRDRGRRDSCDRRGGRESHPHRVRPPRGVADGHRRDVRPSAVPFD